MTDKPIKFYFKDATKTQIENMCAAFNDMVGDTYSEYPRADLGTGFSGDQTMLITKKYGTVDYANQSPFDMGRIEPIVREIAQQAGLDFVKR